MMARIAQFLVDSMIVAVLIALAFILMAMVITVVVDSAEAILRATPLP